MPDIRTFQDNDAVAEAFCTYLADHLKQLNESQNKISIALSGGSTPKLLFEKLAGLGDDAIDWSKVHLFWGDERCVAPTDPESNYGVCKELLLDRVGIAPENVHRIAGENESAQEAARYENEIYEDVEIDDNAIPEFDLVILGMGDDGHTASIFPHQMALMTSDKVCEPAVHPGTGQHRVTITGNVINAAKTVVFLITGAAKADVLAKVIDGSGESYPATHVRPKGELVYFLDEAAAAKL